MYSLEDEYMDTIEPLIGDYYKGGYYAGDLKISDVEYRLILSTKADGEVSRSINNTNTKIPNTSSTFDGFKNTKVMVVSGKSHPAAQFCYDLVVEHYNDWYLPSLYELEIIYRAFKPSTDKNSLFHGKNKYSIPPQLNYTLNTPSQSKFNDFKTFNPEEMLPGWYWSSTESEPCGMFSMILDFKTGLTRHVYKSTVLPTRAIRKEPK